MKPSMKLLAQVLVTGLLASLLAALPAPAAVALTAPATLADRRPVQFGPVGADFEIGYVGVWWETPRGHEHAEDVESGTEPHGAVRFLDDGAWGLWIPLIEDGVQVDDRWVSGLVSGGGADAYQLRGIPADAVKPQAVAINTTDGPLVKVGEVTVGGAHALDSRMCRSRGEWGADESLRFDSNGDEIFVPAFYDVQVTTVHHTATTNDDPDPAATVRAIYRYHAVDQGWGDIGYQYLVDEAGVVYEGRWSGTQSTSCAAGGDGSDFAHEAGSDLMVTGAHTGGWNSGNLGLALLGEFTDHRRFGADPKPEAVDSLTDLLSELAVRHRLDPLAQVLYENPVSGEARTAETIGGHRDYSATECPGQRLYDRLPAIRQEVATRMPGGSDTPPKVTLTHPTDGATVSGVVTVTSDATDDIAVTRVEIAVDGAPVDADSDGADGWAVEWDTSVAGEGEHAVTAVATDSAGQTASDSATVTVTAPGTEPGTSIHVGDLDGTALVQKKEWAASVTITVVDAPGGATVSDATVSGTFTTTGTAVSCVTTAGGTCSVSSSLMPRSTDSAAFTVTGLAHGTLTYEPSRNSDPDGDSDGTSITLSRAST